MKQSAEHISFALHFVIYSEDEYLVSRGAANITGPRHFGYIELTIVAKEARKSIFGDYLWASSSPGTPGIEYLKSIPDGSENNNLGNLPSVSP